MRLAAGERLGPYQIVSLVGEGGMGEVYRARDTRLNRTVAIKVLSGAIDSPVARERFEREARAVSSLNAPNICTLYDVGNENGRDFLVMEYLEGETLADRLSRSRLSTEQVIDYAAQIAEALSRAHAQGVIHRDLKPGNVMLTKSGCKLLDFGLAKTGPGPEWPHGTNDPKRTLTTEGPLLGTCQYMAPELLQGKPADARCDIFAFGAVLYEMLTGNHAFQGNTQAVTIANILEHEPPPISPPAGTPREEALEYVMKTCLVKDPDERRQSAHDIVLELKRIRDVGTDADAPAVRKGRLNLAWGAVLILALAVIGLVLYRGRLQEARVLRVSVLPPEKADFVATSLPALSPDGRRLAFVARTDGKNYLWIRDLDSTTAWRPQGTENASYPFWSPDSGTVAFFAAGKLKKVKLTGGPPAVLCDAVLGRGGSWGPNETILFAPSTGDVIYRVPAQGGTPVPVTALDTSNEELSHRWPWFLPDGRHFLYTGRSSDAAKTAVYAGDLESKQRVRVLPISGNAVYTPPGYLMFVRERTLMAAPFDAKHLRTTGEPFAVAEPVSVIPGNAQSSFTVSDAGVAAYYSGGAGANSQLTWFDRSGKKLGILGEPGNFVQPALSPDGSTLAVDRLNNASGTFDVWLYNLARGTASRFTTDPRQDGYPVWSPDGSRVAFSGNRSGHFDIYVKRAAGADASEETLLASPLDKFVSDWSRDGRYLIYYQVDPKTRYDIWVLPLFGDHKPFPFVTTEFNEHRARLSPDGHWLAYTSDETSRDEIYVQSFPAPGKKWRVSKDGGSRPLWSSNGKELFYIAADRKLMVSSVRADGKAEFTAGVPSPLFETHVNLTRFFAISPDGHRFLLVDNLPEEVTPPITVVFNWKAGIKK